MNWFFYRKWNTNMRQYIYTLKYVLLFSDLNQLMPESHYITMSVTTKIMYLFICSFIRMKFNCFSLNRSEVKKEKNSDGKICVWNEHSWSLLKKECLKSRAGISAMETKEHSQRKTHTYNLGKLQLYCPQALKIHEHYQTHVCLKSFSRKEC